MASAKRNTKTRKTRKVQCGCGICNKKNCKHMRECSHCGDKKCVCKRVGSKRIVQRGGVGNNLGIIDNMQTTPFVSIFANIYNAISGIPQSPTFFNGF